MKVLFVSFTPIGSNTSASLRNKALIKGLYNNGCKVDVISLPSDTTNNYNDNVNGIDMISNIHIIGEHNYYSNLVNTTSYIKRKIIIPISRFLFHKLSIYDNSIFLTEKINANLLNENYYDLVISSSDPKSSHIATKKLFSKGLKYGSWIQYWGDPLTIDITNKTIWPKGILKKIEKNTLKDADKIIYVSPFTLKLQMEIFPDIAEKMLFLPVPYSQEKIYNIRMKDKVNRNIKAGYFGDYYSNVRDISQLYNYFANSKDELIIAGNTDKPLEKLENINIHSRLKQEDIDNLEKDVDILICLLNSSGTQIPGKLYHYASTNKPILVVVDGEYKKEIREYLDGFNRFIVCNNILSDIETAIDQIRNNNLNYSPAKEFDSYLIAQKLIEVFSEKVGNSQKV